VTSVFPADGAEGVPIRQVFTVSFDQDMDATTIDTGSYYMFKTGGIAVPATIRYDAATRTATLTPVAELKAGSTYYVILTGAVKSAAGLSVVGATLTWRFRTAQALPPHIVTKTPPEGATACPLTQVVSVVFDTSMDATTFTSSSFYFAKRGGLPLPAVLA
jgi:hypothetical protein